MLMPFLWGACGAATVLIAQAIFRRRRALLDAYMDGLEPLPPGGTRWARWDANGNIIAQGLGRPSQE